MDQEFLALICGIMHVFLKENPEKIGEVMEAAKEYEKNCFPDDGNALYAMRGAFNDLMRLAASKQEDK